MKRVISILMIICSAFFVTGFTAIAAEYQDTVTNASDSVFFFNDGDYCVITVEDSMARSTKTGNKTYNYYNSDSVLQWKVVVTGTFTYNGTTSSCTSASHTVTIYKDIWHTSSQSSYKSGNSAIADVTMKKTLLGIVTSTRSVNLTLSCDKDGNLS